MANYNTLKTAIQAVINENHNNEITGTDLQNALVSMINSLGAGYQFMGVATPTTNPGTPDQNVFYLASQDGTYTNFGGLIILKEAAIFAYNGQWVKLSTGFASNTQIDDLNQKFESIFEGVENLIDKTLLTRGRYLFINGSGYGPNLSFTLTSVTDYIPINAGESMIATPVSIRNDVAYQLYDENKDWLSSHPQTSNIFTIPTDATNVRYIRITLAVNAVVDVSTIDIRANYGTVLSDLGDKVIKPQYMPSEITESILANQNNIASLTNQMANKLSDAPNDGKQYARKNGTWDEVVTADVEVQDIKDIIFGRDSNYQPNVMFYTNNGNIINQNGWCISTSYIPVNVNDNIEWKPNLFGNVAALLEYDEEYNVLSYNRKASATIVNFTITNSNTKYIRASFSMSDMNAIYLKVNGVTKWIPQDKINSLIDDTYRKFNNTFSKIESVAANGTLSQVPLSIKKNMAMYASINGVVESVQIGFSSHYFTLTPTTISLTRSSTTTKEHGLTLGNHTTIFISRGTETTTNVVICDDYGNSFNTEFDMTYYGASPYFKNNGTNTLQVEFNLSVNDIKKIFGYLAIVIYQ